MSALVLANAFIFQEQLSQSDTRVETLRKLDKRPKIIGEAATHWRWIWENINYVPIFQLGEKVLNELPESGDSTFAVNALLLEAQSICRKQAALRHDLMGRIYHWLLHEAKFLGTYYTSVSAATLLLKLTLSLPWEKDFANPRSLADFKVADLACGTGTLLMAAAQALTDRHIQDRAEQELSLTEKDISILHQTLMQNVLHGYDVLPTALHLTASTLALLAPDVAFRNMNLFVVPMGLDHGKPRLGSLDFLDGPEINTQFALDDTQLDSIKTGAARSTYANAKVPKLDLCVMNPPFVRSVNSNLLFGSLPDERGRLQTELKRRAKSLSASVTAGLGSIFVALADKRLENGGRLAFVLPHALASGEAWAPTRALIAASYHLEYVISSHDASRPNFSENTDMSEILFIARKRVPKGTRETTYINLSSNPRTIYEALAVANCIVQAKEGAIFSDSRLIGERFTLGQPIGELPWTGAMFASGTLATTFEALNKKTLRLPDGTEYPLPLVPLSELGDLGPDQRRIYEAFDHVEHPTAHPAFWNHSAQTVRTIRQSPNSGLIPRKTPRYEQRTTSSDYANYPHKLWHQAATVLLVNRLRTNTHRLIAIGLDKEAFGNTWIALKLRNLSDVQQKALLLWFNSTLGILSLFGNRIITEGAWMNIKKFAWERMPTLDVRALSKEQLRTLGNTYDGIADSELSPIAQLNDDETRKQIDSALAKAMGSPDLTAVRALLATEPGLSAVELSPRHEDDEPDANGDDEPE